MYVVRHEVTKNYLISIPHIKMLTLAHPHQKKNKPIESRGGLEGRIRCDFLKRSLEIMYFIPGVIIVFK